MAQALQDSAMVMLQQRDLIRQRLQRSAMVDADEPRDKAPVPFTAKTPGMMSRRNKPPPAGLSIVAPSHEQFANERVIQSAPLGQSFFTSRHSPHPLTRHVANQSSNLSSTSHIHNVPVPQTSNRLPPISDFFGSNLSGRPENAQSSHHQLPPPPPPTAREYRTAEEAQIELAGGRAELLPKLTRYPAPAPAPPPPPPLPQQQQQQHPHHNSNINPSHAQVLAHAQAQAHAHALAHNQHHHHQPPPQPQPAQQHQQQHPGQLYPPVLPESSRSHNAGRRRTRTEYEEAESPPLGPGPSAQRRYPGAGPDSPETQRAKKEEFLLLCARAWDLFHS